MGIKLEFDKPALYQWDLNMRIILTDIEHIKAGIEVHFESMYTDAECKRAPSYVEDENVYVDIPNVLLQRNDILSVYLYVQDDNKAWTEYKTEILVLPRKKPANYVYNPEEIKIWDKLKKEFEDKIANAGKVQTVNGNKPDENGDVKITIPECKVKTVNEIEPDEKGNIDIQSEILRMLESAKVVVPYHKDEDILFTNDEGKIFIL